MHRDLQVDSVAWDWWRNQTAWDSLACCNQKVDTGSEKHLLFLDFLATSFEGSFQARSFLHFKPRGISLEKNLVTFWKNHRKITKNHRKITEKPQKNYRKNHKNHTNIEEKSHRNHIRIAKITRISYTFLWVIYASFQTWGEAEFEEK